MSNFGISEFLGCMFFFTFLAYLPFAIFDGFGIFRDTFRQSWRKR